MAIKIMLLPRIISAVIYFAMKQGFVRFFNFSNWRPFSYVKHVEKQGN